MSKVSILGIDGGATKVLAQICEFDPKTSLITTNGKHIEYSYHESNNFEPTFKPTKLLQQQKEAKKININFQKMR